MPEPSPDVRSIAGRVAVVTGAGSGMGRATALILASEGAIVAATDVVGTAAEETAAEARRVGGRCDAWALDVSRRTRSHTSWGRSCPGSEASTSW